MNHKFQFLSKSILIIALLFLVACQGDSARELLVKKWKVSAEEYIASLPKDEQVIFRRLPPEIRENMESGSLEFKSNGTYIVAAGFMGQKNMERGRWELRDGGKILVTKRVGGGEQTLDVIELSSKRLIINRKGKEDKMKIILVPA